MRSSSAAGCALKRAETAAAPGSNSAPRPPLPLPGALPLIPKPAAPAPSEVPPTAGPLAKGRAKTKRAAPQLARRYTGPLFEKYNAVLRGLPNRVEKFVGWYMKLCRGNRCECSPLQSAGPDLSDLQ